MPNKANSIIIIVLNERVSLKNKKAKNVVINGIELSVNTAFATDVLARA